MVIFDTTAGFSNRQVAAKFIYNELLDSAARLGMHDAMIHAIDESGMDGTSLVETLSTLLVRMHEEGMGTPEFDATWWHSKE